MTHRVRGAFSRLGAAAFAMVLASALVAGSLAAQGSTGKIEGSVTDQAGVPIANAQVFIVGTSFGALTSDKGYYFINNVPAGEVSLRAQFIGYAPKEVSGVRVLAGQTATINVKMEASAVVVKGVTIEAAVNPIVPRDQVTSKSIVTGKSFSTLPIQDTRDVIRLEPGVVESNSGKGLSIRGGRPGEAAVYVDGVLVRNNQRGETDLNLPTNSIEEASVTTGAVGAEFSQAQSGAISFVTKAGGQKYQGALSYESDELGTLTRNVGFNRIEASVGGPVWGNLTFFVSGTLNGNKSADVAINRDIERPVYVMGGVDTVVREPVAFGNPLSDTVNVAIPRFVQYSGYCNDSPSGSSSTAQIQGNYGSSCQGLRLPYSANGAMLLQSKLQYTYGAGSRISVTGLSSLTQSRNFPGGDIYNSDNFTGTMFSSRAGILNWTQNLSTAADRAMALDFRATLQHDDVLLGPLTRQSELDSRSPLGGFMVSPLKFLTDFNTTHDVTIAGTTYQGVRYLDDAQIHCVQAGQYCRGLIPDNNRDDLNSAQPYRMNPYGVEQSGRGPMFTQGLDAVLQLQRENRFEVYGNFDWQADRFNRVKLGGEYHSIDTRRFASAQNSPGFMSAYHEKPVSFGGYVQDRLDLGDVVLEGGLRVDHFDSRALYPFVPGRITTDFDTLTTDTLNAGSSTCIRPKGAFDPTDPTRRFCKAPAHTAYSPTVRVSFPVTETSNFRLSYAQQVQTPDYDLMFQGINTDLALSNQNQQFGRDLDYTKSIIFEFGIRHAFSQDLVLDVSAYNKDKTSDVAGRLFQLPDPFRSGSPSDFRVFTNADFGNVRGLDVKLDRRFSTLFSGTLAYTFQVAKSTGSDPVSYFNTTARQISTITGTTEPPPQAILTTNDDRPHNIAGAASLTFPNDWQKGTMLGNVLRNVGAFATFRFSSGLPYTRVLQAGEGTIGGAFGLEANPIEPTNSSRMPWFKDLDLRVTKGLRVGSLDWTLFAESKNLFNWTNVVSIFAETGDVQNAVFQKKFLDEQVALLQGEANAAGLGTTDANGNFAADLSAPGVCAGWPGRSTAGQSSAASGPVDCVLLVRAEQRYGNGDGIFTQSEYTKAFKAWYNFFNAPDRFYGAGRRIRLGAELTF